MKTKLIFWTIGVMIGTGIFVYQVYKERLIFHFTGELEYSFSSTTPMDQGWAVRKCGFLGGISLELNNNTYKATCYKFKQL